MLENRTQSQTLHKNESINPSAYHIFHKGKKTIEMIESLCVRCTRLSEEYWWHAMGPQCIDHRICIYERLYILCMIYVIYRYWESDTKLVNCTWDDDGLYHGVPYWNLNQFYESIPPLKGNFHHVSYEINSFYLVERIQSSHQSIYPTIKLPFGVVYFVCLAPAWPLKLRQFHL